MAFLTPGDYEVPIRTNRLTQIIDSTPIILDEAEGTALQIVRDALHSRYDVDAIFATTGTDRPAQVVRWMVTLVLYFLYERIPDNIMPERIKNNYEITLEYLKDLEDGKRDSELPRKTVDDKPKTKFIYGGNTPRTHDLY
jgi:hypothetical protein